MKIKQPTTGASLLSADHMQVTAFGYINSENSNIIHAEL